MKLTHLVKSVDVSHHSLYSRGVKKIILPLIAMCILCTLAPANTKKIKKLTEAGQVIVEVTVNGLAESKAWIQRHWDSKDFKGTNVRSNQQLLEARAFQVEVEAGNKTCKRRIEGKWVTVTATMADVEKATRLDRYWSIDPNTIEDIMNHLRCPLDGTLYSDSFGSVPNE